MQVREADGAWLTVGRVDGGYEEFPMDYELVSAVRLLWSGGGSTPQVAEVIVR